MTAAEHACPGATQDLASSAAAHPPIALRGEDVRHIRPHWRGRGHLRTVEIGLEGGDVILIDAFALKLIFDVYTRLSEPWRT